jgi:p21-activated kinase 1
MAEPQHQKERERRRLTKRITTTSTPSTTNTAAQTPAPPFSARESSFSGRRTSVNSNEVAYSAIHTHQPSSSRTIYAGGAGRLSLSQPDELVGRAFDSQKDPDNTSHAVTPNVYQPVTTPISPPIALSANPRSSVATFIPTPLSHSKTFDERLLSPKLRASQSFAALSAAIKMERISPPRGEKSDQVSPRQRYSDEARPDGKKKSMFANLLNGVKSSPRRPTISTPSNPMHVTHVGIDNETGKFTVSPPPKAIGRPPKRYVC